MYRITMSGRFKACAKEIFNVSSASDDIEDLLETDDAVLLVNEIEDAVNFGLDETIIEIVE